MEIFVNDEQLDFDFDKINNFQDIVDAISGALGLDYRIISISSEHLYIDLQEPDFVNSQLETITLEDISRVNVKVEATEETAFKS